MGNLFSCWLKKFLIFLFGEKAARMSNPEPFDPDLSKSENDPEKRGSRQCPSEDNIKDSFKRYLIAQGYKEYTDKGAPSTVYDYMKRIDFIANEENTDWAGVAANVDTLLEEYGKGGAKAELGARGHDAVINALKRFAEFLREN